MLTGGEPQTRDIDAGLPVFADDNRIGYRPFRGPYDAVTRGGWFRSGEALEI